MTHPAVQRANELAAAATEGWFIPTHVDSIEIWSYANDNPIAVCSLNAPQSNQSALADAEFIAAARTLLPELVEAYEALEERLAESESYAKEGWDWLQEALDALGVKTVFDIDRVVALNARLTAALSATSDGLARCIRGEAAPKQFTDALVEARALLAETEKTP